MASGRWPALPLAAWRDTYDTLHMWSQVVGKLALATTPLSNHYWNVAFQFASYGLVTQPMTVDEGRTLTAAFDFVGHELVLRASDGAVEWVKLEPKTVAQFHAEVMAALGRMGIAIPIWTMPVEWPDPIAFEKDTKHHAYDAQAANAFWRALDSMRPVFEEFRCGFVGKCSPLHFFWGSFDLALSRFSGRRAPPKPDADPVMQESYSHEVISHGFWPGTGETDASFYAYAVPEPPGLKTARVRPAAARYDEVLGEFILPYEAVRMAPNPDEALMQFLESTYEAAADLGRWPRRDLERPTSTW